MARDELTQTKSATDAHTRLIGGIGMGRHDPWVLRDTRSVVKGRGAPGYVEPSIDSSASSQLLYNLVGDLLGEAEPPPSTHLDQP